MCEAPVCVSLGSGRVRHLCVCQLGVWPAGREAPVGKLHVCCGMCVWSKVFVVWVVVS